MPDREGPWHCEHETCSKTHKRKDHWVRCQKSRSQSFLCEGPGCGKQFSRDDTLVEHRLQCEKAGGTPLKCAHGCERTYSSKSSLNRHNTSYDAAHKGGEKAHKCTECDPAKSFARPDLLKQHLETHAARKFKCDFPGCGYKGTRAAHVRVHHQAVHTAEGTPRFFCFMDDCWYSIAVTANIEAASIQEHYRKYHGIADAANP